MKNIILFYYPSLRSTLIYENFIKQYSHLISCVVEVPVIPYSRKTKKRNWGLLKKALAGSKGFFLMSVVTINLYSLIAKIFRKDLKNLCLRMKLNYRYSRQIDSELLSWLDSEKPAWIISSTSTILTKEFISKAKCGVLNVHEGPLPKYKGSACYFWMIANQENFANVTAMYVVEKLDEGDIILNGPKIEITPKTSVFSLWRQQLESYKVVWPNLIEYFEKGIKAPAHSQGPNNYTATSYPDKECEAKIRRMGHKIIQFKDIFWVIKKAVSGKS